MELQVAQEDLEGFLQCRLQEISSQAETQELVEGLARKMLAHTSRVHDLVSIPELAKLEVSLRVNTGLAANQPSGPTSSWASWRVWLGGLVWCLQV